MAGMAVAAFADCVKAHSIPAKRDSAFARPSVRARSVVMMDAAGLAATVTLEKHASRVHVMNQSASRSVKGRNVGMTVVRAAVAIVRMSGPAMTESVKSPPVSLNATVWNVAMMAAMEVAGSVKGTRSATMGNAFASPIAKIWSAERTDAAEVAAIALANLRVARQGHALPLQP